MLPYYTQRYNNLINLDSPLEIDLSFYLNPQGEYVMQANVDVTGEITTSDNKIIFILTRYISDSYSASVCGYEEQNFDLTTPGESGVYETVIDVNGSWDVDDLKAVAIVQTWDNDPGAYQHQIHQAAITQFAFLNPISPAVVEFGDVSVGTSVTEQITITNYWDAELSGDIYSLPGFEIVGNYSVPALETQNLDVTFTPESMMDYYGDIILTTSNENFPVVYVTVSGSGTATDATDETISASTGIVGNHPNPFNPTTTISYNLSSRDAQNAKLVIYNLKGQLVKEFTNLGNRTSVVWNGTDNMGKPVTSGVYYSSLKLETDTGNDKYTSTKKLLLLK
jgi:hypothetical protein